MNLTALLAAVRRQTNLTTADVSDADVTAILNEGIQEIASLKRWDWLYTDSTISVTAGTVEYTLPADFNFMGFVMQDSLSNGPLLMLSHEEYVYRFGDNPSSGSQARYFYLRMDDGVSKIGFYPTPSATSTDEYKIFYYKNPTELAAGGDEPAWDASLHNILVDYAAYRLWEREEYFDETQRAFSKYARRLNDMMRFYKMRGKVNRFIVGGGAYFGGYRDPRVHYGWE